MILWQILLREAANVDIWFYGVSDLSTLYSLDYTNYMVRYVLDIMRFQIFTVLADFTKSILPEVKSFEIVLKPELTVWL